ncbi:MAG TPA: Ig-like domain-containing protein [Candidatus Ornithomonoglobus merdipullorum]|uniref:Ig-like domain-containing protein n=1 Tax=Candidatus Ornithomonoglobus merdipullorum TaxID=2840895 RepID=A0A9D1MDR5_9FIRM|nr:Ig-like domain-containing protein [Candidatus Ornithomonoglobus merdipullorum]
MKAKKILSAVTALTLLPTAGALTGFIPAAAAENSTVTVRLDPSDASPFNNGEFEGWGTSLCWWANRLGYSEKLTQAAAEAFFSDEGLSLDIARYNIGGGDDPTHNHVTRSDSKVPGVWETFEYTNDGADVDITAYDVTNDQNQLNIALAAKAANPDIYFEGFSNSPPYFMTNSGCSSGAADAGSNNLRDDMYDDFAEYIAESTQLLKDNGIVFESYSPMNEPDTNYWGANSNKQEGCHYDPGTSQSKMIVETRKALDEAGLDDVLVAGMDETSIDTSVNNLDQLTDEATDALGRIDTHTYSGSRRTQLKAKAQEMNKDLWMSEVDGGWDGFGLADRIILDMNGMMPSAWVMWDIIDVHKDSDFRDPSGNATEANNSVNYTSSLWGVGMADHDNEELVLTGKYYMFGQFTKYIEPGDTIIASSDSTLAAYNKDTGDIKIVVSNSSGNDIDYSFDLGAFSTVGTDVTEIRSNRDGSEQWATITGEASLTNKVLDTTAKAGTVTTYVVDGTGAANYGVISGAADSLELNATVDLTLETDLTGDVEWSVSNPAVAEITADGALTTKALGTVTVSATVAGKTFSRTFNVPFTGTINGVGRELRVGSTAQLSLTANISGDVAWSVSDTGIATITPEGLITGVTPGEVTIYICFNRRAYARKDNTSSALHSYRNTVMG